MNKKDGTSKSVKEIIAEGYKGNKETSEQVVETPKQAVETVGGSLQHEEESLPVVIESVEVTSQTPGAITRSEEGLVEESTALVTVEQPSKVREEEIEEGELVTDWSDVSPGKASRSPNKSLKYGKVRIATPSRYSALNDIDDNGDLVNLEQRNSMVNIGTEYGESQGDKEQSGEATISPTIDGAVGEPSGKHEEVGTAGGSTLHGTALRPSLPRLSKTNHRVVPEISSKDSETPSHPGKRSTRKSSQ